MRTAKSFAAVSLVLLLSVLNAPRAFAQLAPTPKPTPIRGPAVRGTPLDIFGKPFPCRPHAKNCPSVTLIDSSVTTDANGNTVPNPQILITPTDKHGSFAFSTKGLTPPFLLEGPASFGRFVSIAFGPGHANINAYTNLVLSLIYEVQGLPARSAGQIALDFMGNANTSTPPNAPTREQVNFLSGMLETLFGIWMRAYGVPAGFDFFTAPIPTNNRAFHKLLVNTGIINFSSGTISLSVPVARNARGATAVQNDKLTLDTTNNIINITETVRVTSNFLTSSQRTLSTLVPTSPASSGDLNSAIDGANVLFRRFATAINGQGPSLSAAALTGGKSGNNPLLDSAYVNEGELQAVGAADLTTRFRGASVGNMRLYLIKSYDSSSGLLDALITMTVNGATKLSHQVINCGTGNTFRSGVTICDFLGNQRIARSENAIQIQNSFDSQSSSTTTQRQNLTVEVDGLESDGLPGVTGVAVQDSSVFKKETTLDPTIGAAILTLRPSPSGNRLIVPLDTYVPPAGPSGPFGIGAIFGGRVSVGDVFNFTITPGPIWSSTGLTPNCTSNPALFCYSNPVTTATNEMPNLLNPPLGGSHTIDTAKPGKTLVIKWAPVSTFQVVGIQLTGVANDCATGAISLPQRAISPRATSASISFPAKLRGGGRLARAQFTLSFDGLYGEHTAIRYEFGSCT